MPNYNGLLGQQPDEFPDTKKPGADIFSQFGILTPSEKAAQQAQYQQSQMLLQQELQQRQQQQTIQKAQMGTGYGFPVLTALGGTRQPQQRQSGGMMGGGYQDQGQAEPSRVLQQAVSESGGDTIKGAKLGGMRLLQMAQQKNDPDLAKIAINVITAARQKEMEQQKEEATIANTKSEAVARNQKSGLELAQAGNATETRDFQDIEGRKVTQAAKKNALGQITGWGELGRGYTRQQVETGPPGAFKTKSQEGEDVQNYENLRIAGRTMNKQLDAVIANIDKNPQSAGKAGDIILAGKNVVDTAKQLLMASGKTWEPPRAGDIDPSVWQELNLAGAAKAQERAKLMDVAYSYASMRWGQKGQGASNKDVERVLQRIGASYSDPELSKAMMGDFKDDLGTYINTFAEVKGFEADPAFKKEEAMAKPKSQAEYEALPKGTWYWNPHLNGGKGKRVQKK